MSSLAPPPSALLPSVRASEPMTRTFAPLDEPEAGRSLDRPAPSKVSMSPFSFR